MLPAVAIAARRTAALAAVHAAAVAVSYGGGAAWRAGAGAGAAAGGGGEDGGLGGFRGLGLHGRVHLYAGDSRVALLFRTYSTRTNKEQCFCKRLDVFPNSPIVRF